MCGIFGTLNLNLNNREDEIFNGLHHRGPDEKGAFIKDKISLYHTRLAIQDLNETGRQPMCYKGLCIVFNGEIYNHLELRKRYGLYDDSNSDTKTLLMLYKLLGINMLQQLDGMFAFALYDFEKQELYLARDRAGKKPLYIYQSGDKMAFSSELNVLYKMIKPDINLPALSDYLYLGYHYRKASPYQDVTALENGHYIKINTDSNIRLKYKWFDITDFYQNKSRLSYKASLRELDSKLKLAVNRRIDSSDLDVGCFLSGGIDSGLVTAIAAQHKPDLKTFTVKVEGAYDESALAQQVANKYNTKHTVVNIAFDDLQNDIEQILINYGQPFCDSSAIPSYYVAKAAKNYVTVVLNGDGADELFAGYRRYVPYKHYDFYKTSTFTKSILNKISNFLPINHEKKSNYNYIYRLLKFAGQKDMLKQYCAATSDILVDFEDQFLIKPQLNQITNDLAAINNLAISPLNKMLLMDFQTILFSGLLPKMDIATMAHSLEGRSPFLSKEILEFAPSLKENCKIKGLTTKFILRDLATKYLPTDLIGQPKRGFEIPLKNWVNNQLKEIINDYLLSKNALYPSILKKSFISNLIDQKVNISDEKRAKILFDVFALEVWYKNLQNVNSIPTINRSQNIQIEL